MTKIRILPEHEARKIAAGEVVERPASVVKELLENALDAGATDITLALHDGGKKRIMITDNGCGMSSADAMLSIEHHATSKIRSVDELSHVSTFGFRGEALSSIASVSMMRLTTRRAEDECGFEIFIEQGTCNAGQTVVAPRGTSIIIDDLFANVPARRKFLKQRDTEWRAIHQLVTAYALAFPHIGFTLYHDDQLIYVASPVKALLERAQQLFPPDIAMHLMPCEYNSASITIAGVVSNHQVARYDRKMLFSFVNQRWVKNHTLGKAIIAGYEGMLPPNKYPVAALLITLPKEQVDINVHPRKEEVLLMHPNLVSSAISQAVQQELSKRVSSLIEHRTHQNLAKNPHLPPLKNEQTEKTFASPPPQSNIFEPIVTRKVAGRESFIEQKHVADTSISELYELPQQELPLEKFASVSTTYYDIIGQLHATYILLESSEGLMILDQHAAHEAIIYEELQNKSGVLLATTLLFPECIACDENDRVLLSEVVTYLKGLGIAAEVWSNTHIMVTASPMMLQNVPLADLINLVLEHMREAVSFTQEDLKKQLYHKLYAMIACKKAVKAGDTLSRDEMKHLIVSFVNTTQRLHCPHGRPTSWLVGLYELDKWFKRS